MAIRRISVGCSLTLSFTNKPLRFAFNFATFEEMFEVTVMCFGGRGFFRAELATDGSRDLQGALEFGGCLAFDFSPIAYGDVYVMAGFYFRITNTQTDLSGYLRAGGNLYVLGLVHVSVEFMLMGRYRIEHLPDGRNSNQIYGICTITVSIDLFLVSFDVSITMEKKIAGSEDRDSNQDHARLGRRPLFQFASLRLIEDVNEPPVVAYFYRKPQDVHGRFDYDEKHQQKYVDDWNSKYWSQFAFSE